MSLEFCSVSGYNEVGKNMSAVKCGNDAVILDSGFYLQKLAAFEDNARATMGTEQMIKSGAIADDSCIADWASSVKALIASHAHLDHIGGFPYLAKHYNAPFFGTPYTVAVLQNMLKDDGRHLKNKIHALPSGSSYRVGNIEIEFIHATHSVPQSAMVAVHTKQGVILYTNDYKFDDHPLVGKRPDYERLRELGKEGVKLLVSDSLYCGSYRKTPSEKVAREMLSDVFYDVAHERGTLFVTCFASHLARLKSIVELGEKIDRKVVFVGRSIQKYVHAAESIDLLNFTNAVNVYSGREGSKKIFSKIEKEGKRKYLVVCTGGQGEPNSILNRLMRHALPFSFGAGDTVIFSNRVIPVEPNTSNRQEMERRLRHFGARIFTDVHVSVMPETPVVVNDQHSMKLVEIKNVTQTDHLRVPAFDPNDLKIKWYRANVVKHHYSGHVYSIETKSGRSVEITEGHSVYKLSKGSIVEVRGNELKTGDYILIPKRFKWDKEAVEIDVLEYLNLKNQPKASRYAYDDTWVYYASRKIIPRKIRLDNAFAKLLGYYLAEGSAPRHIALTFGKSEKDFISQAIKLIKKVFSSSIYLDHNGAELRFGSRTLSRLFKMWFNNNARDKKIPDFVFSASEEFKLHFLGSYLDGDAHFEKKKIHPRIRFKTASKRLASDLMYLFSHVGICVKFDHVEINKPRHIAGYKKITGKTTSYVLRIQGRDDMFKIIPYASKRKQKGFSRLYRSYRPLHFPPQSLPLYELNFNEIVPKPNTSLSYYLQCLRQNKKLQKKHIDPKLIIRDSFSVCGLMKTILECDLLFDPITTIKKKQYAGDVYDFSVPGPENFIGGFGGIVLHNSGHGSREDLRDLIRMTNPEHVVPGHGNHALVRPTGDLLEEMGYAKNQFHLMKNGQRLTLA